MCFFLKDTVVMKGLHTLITGMIIMLIYDEETFMAF